MIPGVPGPTVPAMKFIRGLFASTLYALGLVRLGERLDPVLRKAKRGDVVKTSEHPF